MQAEAYVRARPALAVGQRCRKWKNSFVLGPVSVPQSEDDISGKQLQLDF